MSDEQPQTDEMPTKVWTFAYKSRCPVCKSLNTKVRRTCKVKQLRTCNDCGEKYVQGGILI